MAYILTAKGEEKNKRSLKSTLERYRERQTWVPYVNFHFLVFQISPQKKHMFNSIQFHSIIKIQLSPSLYINIPNQFESSFIPLYPFLHTPQLIHIHRISHFLKNKKTNHMSCDFYMHKLLCQPTTPHYKRKKNIDISVVSFFPPPLIIILEMAIRKI